MIYASNDQRVEDMQRVFGGGKGAYRMAKVMDVQEGRPVIRFNGEQENSVKKYKHLASYTPTAGDYVLLAAVSRTYVIIGKVV